MKKLLFIIFLMVLVISNYTSKSNANVTNLTETDVEYDKLKDKLDLLLKKEQGTYGISVIDINSGATCAINPLEPFHAASTFKLPLNIYLIEQISLGKVNPKQMLVYKAGHKEGGTGKLQNKAVGSSFNIEMLSKYSIVYSDNVATNMLVSYLGKPNVKNLMRSMGGVVVNDKKNVTCPQDMALYMYQLLELAPKEPELVGKLINYLENTVYNDRIPKLLPQDIKTAHKIGNWPPTVTYSDVGYVQHPTNPYIIAIFSKGTPGVDRAFNVIQRVSRTVYDYQSGFKLFLDVSHRPSG